MLLATYQPIDDAKRDVCKYPDLTIHLGYDPIICFPANNAREIMFYSMLVNTADYPEKLIVFESNEFDEVDMVQWSKKMATDYQTQQNRLNRTQNATMQMTVADCFTDKDRLYKFCAVKDIQNVIVEMDIKEMLFLDLDTTKSEWKGFLHEVVTSAQQCAISLCKNLTPPLAMESSWDQYSIVAHQYIKEGFQGLLLPIIYPIVLERPISYSTYFNYQEYMNRMVINKISRLMSPNEDMEYKTYQMFDEIARDLRSCMTKTYDRTLSDGFNNTDTELGPNSMCPCGSGKKYKKCCKNTILERL